MGKWYQQLHYVENQICLSYCDSWGTAQAEHLGAF